MFYVYILKSKKDNSVYIDYTSDLKRRFEEHNNGIGQFTKFKRPFELVYYEAYKSKSDTKYREKNIKRFAQSYTALKNRIRNSLIL